MRKKNTLLMMQARLALKNNWGNAILACLLVYFLTSASQQCVSILLSSFHFSFLDRVTDDYCQLLYHFIPNKGGIDVTPLAHQLAMIPYITLIVSLLICPSILLGQAGFFLNLSRKKDLNVAVIFDGFKNYKTITLVSLLKNFTIAAGYILLFVPGLIVGLGLALTNYIIADNPSTGVMDALNKSWNMMSGYKWKLFCLQLRYMLYILLSIFTLGIALIWIIPYIYAGLAEFYENVKEMYDEPKIE